MNRRILLLAIGHLMAACIDHNPQLDTDPDAAGASEAPDAVLVHGRNVVFAVAEPDAVDAADAELPNDARLTDDMPCPEKLGTLFDVAAPAPAVDGCEAQCIRLAHCASHTWDDGSDQCRCLEDDDEPAILDACKATCHTTQGELLYYALFDTPVCSEIVPAVTSRFPTFDVACGGRP